MSSPSRIQLSPDDTGVVRFQPQDLETATVTSQLLQRNHDEHHIFYNEDGYHNHIVHHLLTLYGLGAPAAIIEKQYKHNAVYQRALEPVDEFNVRKMRDPEHFKEFLGCAQRYHDFLVFFQRELGENGVDVVLQTYLFSGTALADDLLVRLFAGFLHPLIHLGFGLEFHQPAIVAEALAQLSVHPNWMAPFFYGAEEEAKAKGESIKTLPSLLDEIRQDTVLSTAAEWGDGNKIRDGILVRAPNKAIHYASQWTVTEQNLEAKVVEMINTAVYFTATAQHPPKQVKMDFYFLHCVNASIFWAIFNKLPWLSVEAKIRLLEWKGRNDLVMYASRRSPPLLIEEVTGYVPRELEVGNSEFNGVVKRLLDFEDDGHAIKMLRAVAYGEAVSGKHESEDWCRIKGFMWLKIQNMVADSVEDEGATWARSVGFEEAWQEYGVRLGKSHI